MKLRDAAQMALDALSMAVEPKKGKVYAFEFQPIDCAAMHLKAIEALRAALAQPEQEPVAWWHDRGDVVDLNVSGHGTPLYFAPPQREWKGLTDEERKEIIRQQKDFWGPVGWELECTKAIEAKLREKNFDRPS